MREVEIELFQGATYFSGKNKKISFLLTYVRKGAIFKTHKTYNNNMI